MRLNHPFKTDGGCWHPVTACSCPLYSKQSIKQVPRKSNTSKIKHARKPAILQLYALFVSALNAENLEFQTMFINKVIQPRQTV